MALTEDQKARLKSHAKNNPMPGTTSRELTEGRPLHVDGDYLAYHAAGSDDTSPAESRERVLSRIRLASRAGGCDRVIVHLSAGNCDKGLRFHISGATPLSKLYQNQRNSGRKPKNWEYLREYLETYEGDAFKVMIWHDREADDAMAYCAEAAYKLGRSAAIHTADKDMRMFAGVHVRWDDYNVTDVVPGTYDHVFCGKQYGHKWFWMQMIQGDGADNIPGVPRAGEVAANNLLADTRSNTEAYGIVRGLYIAKCGEDYADFFVEQASLLWMRTDKAAHPNDFLTMPMNPLSADPVIWDIDILRAARRMELRIPMREGQ